MANEVVTKTTLGLDQKRRALALEAAKLVLTGTGSMFGGTDNHRSTAELIEIAEYIIGTEHDGGEAGQTEDASTLREGTLEEPVMGAF